MKSNDSSENNKPISNINRDSYPNIDDPKPPLGLPPYIEPNLQQQPKYPDPHYQFSHNPISKTVSSQSPKIPSNSRYPFNPSAHHESESQIDSYPIHSTYSYGPRYYDPSQVGPKPEPKKIYSNQSFHSTSNEEYSNTPDYSHPAYNPPPQRDYKNNHSQPKESDIPSEKPANQPDFSYPPIRPPYPNYDNNNIPIDPNQNISKIPLPPNDQSSSSKWNPTRRNAPPPKKQGRPKSKPPVIPSDTPNKDFAVPNQYNRIPSGRNPHRSSIDSSAPPAQRALQTQSLEEETDLGSIDGKPINVKDAMSYLDLVKYQFRNQPEIYNQFLGIMKDFKSNDIDTPGVIDRVSALFKGHPILIQGFNTFLPPGYLIECSENPYAPVRVTTPSSNPNNYHAPEAPKPPIIYLENSLNPETLPKKPFIRPQPTIDTYLPNPPTIKPIPPREQSIPTKNLTSFESSDLIKSPYSQNTSGYVIYPPKQNPLEFNHAISFVNKIKNRFSNDSERYAEFLDILNSYQRDGEPITNVYEKIRILFSNDEDLLEEFKLFLPDNSQIVPPYSNEAPIHHHHQHQYQHQIQNQNPHQNQNQIQSIQPSVNDQRSLSTSVKDLENQNPQSSSQLPPLGSFTPTVDENIYSSYEYPSNGSHLAESQLPPKKMNASNELAIAKQSSRKKRIAQTQDGAPNKRRSKAADEQTLKDSQVPPADIQFFLPSGSEKDYIFFERLKQFFGKSHLYGEFIKLLNLYNQEILDEDSLLEGAEKFIGSDQNLFNWFKIFVNSYKPSNSAYAENNTAYDPVNSTDVIPDTQDSSVPEFNNDLSSARPKPILESCKSYGPSYKLLHRIDYESKCSGRDSMCWEVLNDSWVSHPTWASEESEFVHHKKNQYEDALFRCEEDRHEMDINIESNLSLIRVLTSSLHQVELMSEEEKSQIDLKVLLNGHSESLFRRTLRKIYDSQRLPEILDAFNSHPLAAVPVILKRLKQKDDEWRKQRRTMIKIWREIDSKNFFKSLDHNGLTLKANDRKGLSSKVLISEIESIRLEQLKSHDADKEPFKKLKHRFQLEYAFENHQTVSDIIDFILIYIRKQNANLSQSEKSEVETVYNEFFSSFFWNFFGVEKAKHDKKTSSVSGDESTDIKTPPKIFKLESSDEPKEDILKPEISLSTSNRSLIPEHNDIVQGFERTQSPCPINIDNNNNTKISFNRSVSYSNRTSMVSMNLSKVSSMSWISGGIQTNKLSKSVSSGNLLKSANVICEDTNSPAKASDNLIANHKSNESLCSQSNIGNSNSKSADLISTDNYLASEKKLESRVFYCNSMIYVFVRLFQTIYSRACIIKKVALDIQDISKKKEETVAKKLNFRKIPQGLIDYDLSSIDYYSLMLELVSKQINGQLDNNSFEDSVRYLFGSNAHLLLTFDRVISLIAKQVQNLVNDSRSTDLIEQLNSLNVTNNSNLRDYISYRINAQEIVGSSEYVYRLDYLYLSNTLTIQLLKPQDSTLDINLSMEDRWAYYVDSYILFEPTEGIPRHKRNGYGLVHSSNKSFGTDVNTNKDLLSEQIKKSDSAKKEPKYSGTSGRDKSRSKDSKSSTGLKSPGTSSESSRRLLYKFPLLPYLKRNIVPNDYENVNFYVSSVSNLEIKIAVNDYKLCFLTKSEDNYANHSRRRDFRLDSTQKRFKSKSEQCNKKWKEFVESKIDNNS
ncbi:Paired amphipathic helix protein pst1 [Smittium culicis]|uniref:Paired amphipathic helix protein pst1 n=1 Tax=Smittium culicis TaxID=133412 RepID=A0A1R1XNE1_9FUNG|nr:Paired amphipathic helix protein pst1 [Smittium culicis]